MVYSIKPLNCELIPFLDYHPLDRQVISKFIQMIFDNPCLLKTINDAKDHILNLNKKFGKENEGGISYSIYLKDTLYQKIQVTKLPHVIDSLEINLISMNYPISLDKVEIEKTVQSRHLFLKNKSVKIADLVLT